jgi:hypothetical protein
MHCAALLRVVFGPTNSSDTCVLDTDMHATILHARWLMTGHVLRRAVEVLVGVILVAPQRRVLFTHVDLQRAVAM